LDTVNSGKVLVAVGADPVSSAGVSTRKFNNVDVSSSAVSNSGLGVRSLYGQIVVGVGSGLDEDLMGVVNGGVADSVPPCRLASAGVLGAVKAAFESEDTTENTGSGVGTDASLFVVDVVSGASVGVESDIRNGPLAVTDDSVGKLVVILAASNLDFDIFVGIGTRKLDLVDQNAVNLDPEGLTVPLSDEVDSETDGDTLVADAGEGVYSGNLSSTGADTKRHGSTQGSLATEDTPVGSGGGVSGD
jgi:hypothetical protein